MTLRRIEARFLLPDPVRRAAVLGADGWREELERAGVEVSANGADGLDLAVASAERAAEARSLGATATIVEGRGAKLPGSRAYLPLPGPGEPLVFVPIGSPGPSRYAVAQWAFADRRWKRARNRAVGALAGRGLLPPVRPLVKVSAPDGPPFLVRAAREHGIPDGAVPLLVAGQGDDYSRGAFLLFEPGADEPAWALKFGRLPVPLPSFEREERGLEIAREAGGVVAAHAPRRLARFEAEGLQCALETAAQGRSLLAILSGAPTAAEQERLIDRVCDWLAEVARSTAAPAEALEPEQRRLAADVLPAWGLDGELAATLPPTVPAVLQHNDLGSWNVIVGGDGFTVLDWEDAVRHGLPLWDLLYFLADAAANLEGMGAAADRPRHFEQLFAGERPTSALVLARVRRMVDALAIPPEAVGPIATLCWLHHGLAGRRRAAESGPARESRTPDMWRELAERWLRHPALGPGWNRWAG